MNCSEAQCDLSILRISLGAKQSAARLGPPPHAPFPSHAGNFTLQCCKRKVLSLGIHVEPSNVRPSLCYHDYLSSLPAVECAREQ
jgi:hypothetical protein